VAAESAARAALGGRLEAVQGILTGHCTLPGILLRVHAQCIDSQDHIATRRIEDALGDPGEPRGQRPRARPRRADPEGTTETWARIGRSQPPQTGVSRSQPENTRTAPHLTRLGGAPFFELTFGSPLRNRTVDLLLTISTFGYDGRMSCADATRNRTDCTGCAGNSPRPSPRPGPWRSYLP